MSYPDLHGLAAGRARRAAETLALAPTKRNLTVDLSGVGPATSAPTYTTRLLGPCELLAAGEREGVPGAERVTV